jgi:hypothetical protein
MRKRTRPTLAPGILLRRIALGLASVVGAVVGLLAALAHEPSFYREAAIAPGAFADAQVRNLLTRGLQLRNDIVNEPRWDAIFSDSEINAWLAEEAARPDTLPPGFTEPRLSFEMDRILIACKVRQGPISSLVWVAAQARSVGPSELELVVERVSAGLVPLPRALVRGRLEILAKAMGLELTWREVANQHVALVRPKLVDSSANVVLDRFEILNGQIRVVGRTVKRVQTANALEDQRRS